MSFSARPAVLSLDIVRAASGLTLTPTFTLDEHPLEARTVILLGDPAHGLASWTETNTQPTAPPKAKAAPKRYPTQGYAAQGYGAQSYAARARAAAASEALPTEIQLTLARLSTPVDPTLRGVAATHTALVVPPADEQRFVADYYPHLRAQLSLSSKDGSFELAAVPEPQLVLSIASLPDARIQLSWHWRYVTAAPESSNAGTGAPDGGTAEPALTAMFVRPLYDNGALPPSARPHSNDTYRNVAGELAIVESLHGLLHRWELLAEPAAFGSAGSTLRTSTPGTGTANLGTPGTGTPGTSTPGTSTAGTPSAIRLAARSELTGTAMLDFLATEVPQLEASAGLSVLFVDALPEYREASEAPIITLATHERPDDRDWFDLAVEVTVDGQKIAFDELFRALASDSNVMIMPSDVWFSLDRPELHQLRRLIDEARALQEPHAKGLGISRFQADLWDELLELGIVSQQAGAWRLAVTGLAAGAAVTTRALPATLHATLRPYQQQGFEWLSFLCEQGLGGVLADDMGLGKTLQVIAPTSVVPNWAAECAKFAPGLKVVAIRETTSKRSATLAAAIAGADVVVSSYTLFRLDFDEYSSHDWSGLLLDEAQFVKNHQSKAHQCARRLQTPFKLAITGTPLENNLMELWSLFSIAAPGLFPSPSKFGEIYQKAIEKDADGERLAQLRRRIRPFMLRRTKDEVATDLPAKQEQVLELEMHPKHRRVYETHLQRERRKVLGLIDDMNANRFEIFRSLTMLRQLSLDASLYDEKYADIPSTKLDALLEMLDDTVAEGHRTLIFSQFTGFLAKARARLDAAGIAYSYLDGSTRNRAKAIAEFKDGSNPVFLISLKAGGFGLNLTEADYVILLDPWWNPATEAQAVDRTHRIGQTKNVMVYRLVSKNTIEEKVMAMKETKSKLFDSVMTEGAAPGGKLTAADIRELLE